MVSFTCLPPEVYLQEAPTGQRNSGSSCSPLLCSKVLQLWLLLHRTLLLLGRPDVGAAALGESGLGTSQSPQARGSGTLLPCCAGMLTANARPKVPCDLHAERGPQRDRFETGTAATCCVGAYRSRTVPPPLVPIPLASSKSLNPAYLTHRGLSQIRGSLIWK